MSKIRKPARVSENLEHAAGVAAGVVLEGDDRLVLGEGREPSSAGPRALPPPRRT